jgi:hypothetical protein
MAARDRAEEIADVVAELADALDEGPCVDCLRHRAWYRSGALGTV